MGNSRGVFFYGGPDLAVGWTHRDAAVAGKLGVWSVNSFSHVREELKQLKAIRESAVGPNAGWPVVR